GLGRLAHDREAPADHLAGLVVAELLVKLRAAHHVGEQNRNFYFPTHGFLPRQRGEVSGIIRRARCPSRDHGQRGPRAPPPEKCAFTVGYALLRRKASGTRRGSTHRSTRASRCVLERRGGPIGPRPATSRRRRTRSRRDRARRYPSRRTRRWPRPRRPRPPSRRGPSRSRPRRAARGSRASSTSATRS